MMFYLHSRYSYFEFVLSISSKFYEGLKLHFAVFHDVNFVVFQLIKNAG